MTCDLGTIGSLTVTVDVIPSTDPKWPWKVRITTRQPDGQLVGVRNLRQRTESEAVKHAAQLRASKGWA